VLSFESHYKNVHHFQRSMVYNQFTTPKNYVLEQKPVAGSLINEKDRDSGVSSKSSESSGESSSSSESSSASSGESQMAILDDFIKFDLVALSIRLELFTEALRTAPKLFKTFKVINVFLEVHCPVEDRDVTDFTEQLQQLYKEGKYVGRIITREHSSAVPKDYLDPPHVEMLEENQIEEYSEEVSTKCKKRKDHSAPYSTIWLTRDTRFGFVE
jgi:hypothetical protein